MNQTTGYLEVITGPMYSGKTEELIRRIRRAVIAKKDIQVFKHFIDTRYGKDNKLYSHAGITVESERIHKPSAIIHKTRKKTVIVVIDEAQWFGQDLIDVVQQLLKQGKHVIVAGLALTYDRQPFAPIPELMALADTVTKLTAVCTVCGGDAVYHKRIENQVRVNPLNPSPALVGHTAYAPRCRTCYPIKP